MQRLTAVLFATILCLVSAMASVAAAGDSDAPPSVQMRVERQAVVYRINDDLTHVEEHEYQVRVLHENVLENAKDAHISYSTSVQRVEIIEAYTLKADGTRLPVPPENFQEKANTGYRGNGPVYSDYASLGLVFPRLAVGDATYLHYRIVQKEPIFPGQFDMADVFYPSQAIDEARIVIDAPQSLHARHQARDMQENEEIRDGRRVLTFVWRNPKPVREKRRDWSVFDAGDYPGLAYSTFDSYEAIARAYGERATPRAAVTTPVRKLATEIARGQKTPRDKARVLYEWVARNITYAGNCVGVGAVVPHDTDFILGNRMGDCKDHATLLQALLAAQGIASTQALVNASSSYALPPVPLVSSVNHVINYIPSLDLFLDSTSPDTPFGHLPQQVAGKPVLLVDGFRTGLRTPVPSPQANRQTLVAETTFLPDGTARGTVRVEQQGEFAIESRAGARRMTPEYTDEMLQELFDNNGQKGFGNLDSEDPGALTDTYRYVVSFERPQSLLLPGAGGFPLRAFYGTNAGIDRFVQTQIDIGDEHEVGCTGGVSIETHRLRLPEGTTIFAIPDDVHIASGPLRYDATYLREGTTVSVTRKIEDGTTGPVCDSRQVREYEQFSRRVLRDLRAQVVYQLKEGAETP